MRVSKLEREIGIEVYGTHLPGIGGRLRQFPEDFEVEEVLKNGSKAQTKPLIIPQIAGRGRNLICVLVKRNFDTFLAIRAVAKRLGVSQERIGFAGIKDTKALTAQHISISRMLPEQIAPLKVKNLWLYPLSFSSEKMHSGLLAGNQFRIIIRAIDYSRSEITKRLYGVRDRLLKLGGCPNFFGHQRFGTVRPITHLVGRHILLGQWERAVLMFLAKPSAYEHPQSRQAREQLWNTRNYDEALGSFPSKLVYERQMLGHLVKQPRDFIGAFHRLPRKLCNLFVQAYQSYLFNRFLSQRIQHGLPLMETLQGECSVYVNGKERLALPLIGYRHSFSGGKQGEIERRILEEEGVRPGDFRISLMPRISSQGGLRIALSPLDGSRIEEAERDEANPNKKMVSLSFALRKGSYATVVLREFMKPPNPVAAGF